MKTNPLQTVLSKFRPYCVSMTLTFVVFSGFSVLAEEDDRKNPKEDPYESVWQSVSDLLRRREYASANGLLESLSDDPDLQYHAKLIESDKSAVAGLQTLERLVLDYASKLPDDAELKISGTEYRFVRFDKSLKGESLVLKLPGNKDEIHKPIIKLPTDIWMQFSKSKLDVLEQPELILGVFIGFDKNSNPKEARKLLNEAAGKGADVTLWLARLEQEVSGPKKSEEDEASQAVDPIIGRWRLVIGRKGHANRVDVEFRDKGALSFTRDADTGPKKGARQRLNPLSGKGKWVKQESGTYMITVANGSTMELDVVGHSIQGTNASGAPVNGFRHATQTKK